MKILIILFFLVLTGCANTMTGKALDTASDEFSKGNLIAGAWTGTMGVFLGAIIDTVTLGGTQSAKDTADTLTQAATTLNENRNLNSNGYRNNSSSKADTLQKLLSFVDQDNSDIGTSIEQGSIYAGSATTSNCRANISYIKERFPHFNAREIENAKNEMFSATLNETMRSVKSQGFSPEAAVKATMQQAKAFDQTAQDALRTASQTNAFGTTEEQFLSQLNNGSLNVKDCTGIHNASLCTAIVNKMGAIAARATAAEMQCHIRAGSWPR